MAKKDFDLYLLQIAKQYQDLKSVWEDLSKEYQNGMVEPERLENAKKTLAPIEDAYKTLTYVAYLLNKPTKKSKSAMFDRYNKKALEISDGKHKEQVLSKNKSLMEKVRNNG